jgi:hypothetical protein
MAPTTLYPSSVPHGRSALWTGTEILKSQKIVTVHHNCTRTLTFDSFGQQTSTNGTLRQ